MQEICEFMTIRKSDMKSPPQNPEPHRNADAEADTSAQPAFGRGDLDQFTVVKIARLGMARELATASFFEPRYGLKNAELKVLISLGVGGAMTMGRLSRETRLDKAWVSRSVYGLIDRGIVTKSAAPDDGRAVLLKLTRKGAKLMKEIGPILAEREKRLLLGLDKQHVNWLLDTLLTRLEGMRDNPPFG